MEAHRLYSLTDCLTVTYVALTHRPVQLPKQDMLQSQAVTGLTFYDNT